MWSSTPGHVFGVWGVCVCVSELGLGVIVNLVCEPIFKDLFGCGRCPMNVVLFCGEGVMGD